MSFFPEEQGADLRELFFETAAELLQSLNEEGLQMEKRPGDAEIIRHIRRTVHTLKGDSAACGYGEMSELAHQLEDLFTPEIAAHKHAALAEIVLIAADAFSAMLAAYRENLQPPVSEELRRQMLALTGDSAGSGHQAQAHSTWSEYEQMVIDDALGKGETVFKIAFGIDPQCPVRAAAMQLIRNVLNECGRLLAIAPDQSTITANIKVVDAAIVSSHNLKWLQKKCRIPAVVTEVTIEPVERRSHDRPDAVLDAFRHSPEDVAREETHLQEPSEDRSRPASEVPAPAAAEPAGAASGPETNLRVDATRIDTVLNLVGELIIGKSMMQQTINEFQQRFPKDPLKAKFTDALAFQARIINDLQKSVMEIRMVPVEQLFRRFPRVIRDVAKSCGKDVALVLNGQDTDLDKSILDMLGEPLTHLVRNAIDHGIESPQERINAGKPAQGTITLNAYHQGSQIVIEVADDGRGIDKARVIAKAIEIGSLSQSEADTLSEGQALNLVFNPGLSTADQVTSISGRGVGMDVVKSVVERLKGTVSIKVAPGKGSIFYLRVPLTLAIIQALLFRVGEKTYAVPLGSVVEITRISQNDIHLVDQREVIQVREEVLSLVHLGHLANRSTRANRMFVVVISLGDQKFGLVVDRLVGEEELVMKALDNQLVATDLVSGASILGDGTVVLVLNL
ncbi:MAG TPA: chemotaxis protein CheA, partial [Candidatus Saccharimonadales bacterium]|nr:chemotaxis protein CheA [Candidatus Saccharimonadales bacterium]